MTCRDFAGFMADYLSGELTSDVRAAFEHHLSLCDNCVNYLARYKATVAAGKLAFEGAGDEVPGDVPDDLIRAILAARRN